MESDSAPVYGDGGWGRLGAVTLPPEMLYVRMRRLTEASATGGTQLALQNELPQLGFSRVVQIFLKNAEVHAVHDRSGFTDADVIVHFEKLGVLLLGNIFTADGYPAIDLTRGGTISGLIRWVDWFTGNFSPQTIERIVPGRGPVATMKDLRDYRDMLVAIRDTVLAMRKSGKGLGEVMEARPTLRFDARWGHGPVTADQFVKMVYESPPGT